MNDTKQLHEDLIRHQDSDEKNFKDIHAKLDMILVQTTKTNGTVSEHKVKLADLEETTSTFQKWRWMISGGAVVLGALSIPNISAIIKLLE